jgi:hypothetical protein
MSPDFHQFSFRQTDDFLGQERAMTKTNIWGHTRPCAELVHRPLPMVFRLQPQYLTESLIHVIASSGATCQAPTSAMKAPATQAMIRFV